MDASSFHLLVKNFTNLTQDEFAEVGKLLKEHPYSQMLHLLRSRAALDLKSPEKTEILNQSAVYSTDRNVLKWVMNAGKSERISHPALSPQSMPEEPRAVTLKPLIEEQKSQPVQTAFQTASLDGDALRDDLIRELQKLKRLKHDFEVSVDEFNKSIGNGVQTSPPLEGTKEPVGDPLLEELKSTKKKLKVGGTKQKEQNEIIEQFIKTKPVLSKPKPVGASEDLSEDSGIFSDNIISETLVDILLKQGKKEKAIEVLKKLIWKFPQKKTYFAAQIEKLKN